MKNNLGITLISKLVIESSIHDNELKFNDFNGKLTRFFSYITPKNITISKAVQVFIEELNNYYKETSK